jgi:protein phosphatase
VETVLAYFRDRKPAVEEDAYLDDAPLGARLLADAVKRANDAILAYAEQNKNTSGMGTTLVAARFADGVFSIANVGDSRIYLFREGQLLQLTEDHSLVMEQVRRGLMTMEEAEHSNVQNVIVRALGIDDSVEPDLADHQLAAGDILLLCCDGLSRFVKNEKMIEVATQDSSLEQACADLVEAAKAGGSDDNITCLLVRATHPSWRDRWFGRLSGQSTQQSST